MGFFDQNRNRNVWICAYSFVLLNYNCIITSYLLILRSEIESVSSYDEFFASLSVVLGLFVGQLIFGILGDAFGRTKSFTGSVSLMILGSIVSIFTGHVPFVSGRMSFMVEFAIFHFIVGLGAGGLFPTVATITRESSQQEMANTEVALVYGPVGSLGLLLGPLLVYIMSWTSWAYDFQWRVLLLIGALLSSVMLIISIEETGIDSGDFPSNIPRDYVKRIEEYEALPSVPFDSTANTTLEESKRSIYRWLRSAKVFTLHLSYSFRRYEYRSFLLGSSLSWFFCNFMHYGNLLFQAKFLVELLGGGDLDDVDHYTVGSLAAIGCFVAALFWVGGILSILVLKHLSALALQLHSFVALSGLCFLICALQALVSNFPGYLSVTMYSFIYLLNGLGPAPTTFLIPSLLFPKSIRTTANGVAAAIGTIGAIAGIVVVSMFGVNMIAIMAMFGAVNILGGTATIFTMKALMTERSRANSIVRSSSGDDKGDRAARDSNSTEDRGSDGSSCVNLYDTSTTLEKGNNAPVLGISFTNDHSECKAEDFAYLIANSP